MSWFWEARHSARRIRPSQRLRSPTTRAKKGRIFLAKTRAKKASRKSKRSPCGGQSGQKLFFSYFPLDFNDVTPYNPRMIFKISRPFFVILSFILLASCAGSRWDFTQAVNKEPNLRVRVNGRTT